jgi:hypothetical protein
MRKLVLCGILTTLGVSLLALPAQASFERHFTVLEGALKVNDSRFKARLFDPRHGHDRVGRERGACKPRPNGHLKCRVTFYLGGKIGGSGFIWTKGNLGPNDNRLNVLGGSGDFRDIAGKVLIREARGSHNSKLGFHLVR